MAPEAEPTMLTGSFRVDSIKKAARREAWYRQDSDTSKTYNIFGRVDTRPQKNRRRDVEEGLYKTKSENNAGSPTEDARKKSYEQDREGFGGAHKAGTFPPGPTGNLPHSRDDNEISSGYDESRPSTEKQDSTDVNGTAAAKTVDDAGPRRRKGLKFWKKEGEPSEKDTNGKERRRDKFGPAPPVMSQFKAVFFSWINLLLLFVPVGFALNYAGVNRIVVFVINFLAIIPLAAMLSFATEELALYIGETLGGLLNATFGNAVELIVSVIALTQGKVIIVQTSLIGSMLSNLLLVLGMCFFFGGINRVEQYFNVTVAQTAASLLALAIGSVIIPTAFRIFSENDNGVAPTSRGTSVLLLVTYACYLIFQLRTHVDMYNEPSQKAPKKSTGKKAAGDASRGIAAIGAGTGAAMTGGEHMHEEDEEPETPQLSILGALITLGGSTVLIAFCAEFMVSAIDAVASEGVSEEFIGLILLPIVGNAAEHATAVTVAIKDKLDLSIGVAIGSSLQIALLVLPFMVLLSWFGVGKGMPVDNPSGPMTLDFDGFQIAVLFIAVILVNYLIGDGKSHWLEGVLLNITYLIIALAAWFYPNGTEAPA